jgi:hypothetical protein
MGRGLRQAQLGLGERGARASLEWRAGAAVHGVCYARQHA